MKNFQKFCLIKFLFIFSFSSFGNPIPVEITYRIIVQLISNHLNSDQYIKDQSYKFLSKKYNNKFPIKEKTIKITKRTKKRWIKNQLKGYLGAYFNTKKELKPFAYSYVIQHSKDSALKEFIKNNNPEKMKTFFYFKIIRYFIDQKNIKGELLINQNYINFKINYSIENNYFIVNKVELYQ